MLVLHYTGMQTPQAAFERLRNPAAKVSAHYLVDEQGGVFRLVDEANRAWHAGLSSWRGERDINKVSIGIEIVNPGHEWGYRPFPDVQMRAAIALCQDILKRHPIEARNIVAHSDIAPARKQDPGELFDWAWLAREGIGLWPREALGIRHLASGKERSAPPNAQSLMPNALSTYGYDTANLQAAITAFQRHFFPKNLHSQWDSDCQMTLDALLKMV